MKRPGCWPMLNTIWRRTIHRTCSMCSTSWSKRFQAPWPRKSGLPTRRSVKPGISSGRSKPTSKARVTSPQSAVPGRPPKEPVSLEQAEQALDAASREHERLTQQREHVAKSIRGIGHDYDFVDLDRGIRRNGQLIAADIPAHIEQVRAIAQHEGLSQSCLERIEKAERVVPKMQATIEFVSGYVRQQVAQLDLTPPASFAMHAKLIPSYYLDRVAHTRSVRDGEPLRALAERL